MSVVKDRAVTLACSALLSGAARDALKSFFRNTQQATQQPSAALRHDHLCARLLAAGTAAPRAAQRSAAECIAALCEGNNDRIVETLRLCITALSKSGMVRPRPQHH